MWILGLKGSMRHKRTSRSFNKTANFDSFYTRLGKVNEMEVIRVSVIIHAVTVKAPPRPSSRTKIRSVIAYVARNVL